MVYTDKIHLVADSKRELHDFAFLIGLKRHFYEGTRKGHPHYDLTNKYIMKKAIENGAKIITSKELIIISHKLN